MAEIIPSILSQTKEDFDERIKKIQPFVTRVHLDIADGEFVPNKTIAGYTELLQINTPLEFDVHLMVKMPASQVHEWLKTKVDRIIFHVETNHVLKEMAEVIHLNGKKFGLAINPDTNVEILEEHLEHADFIHFLSVQPGFYGGEFIPQVISKISMFHEQHPEMPIMVDGGVTPENATQLVMAGASMLVSGSYIWNSSDIKSAIDKLGGFSMSQ
jgi:ribulose-phosphate 3-epimerase